MTEITRPARALRRGGIPWGRFAIVPNASLFCRTVNIRPSTAKTVRNRPRVVEFGPISAELRPHPSATPCPSFGRNRHKSGRLPAKGGPRLARCGHSRPELAVGPNIARCGQTCGDVGRCWAGVARIRPTIWRGGLVPIWARIRRAGAENLGWRDPLRPRHPESQLQPMQFRSKRPRARHAPSLGRRWDSGRRLVARRSGAGGTLLVRCSGGAWAPLGRRLCAARARAAQVDQAEASAKVGLGFTPTLGWARQELGSLGRLRHNFGGHRPHSGRHLQHMLGDFGPSWCGFEQAWGWVRPGLEKPYFHRVRPDALGCTNPAIRG